MQIQLDTLATAQCRRVFPEKISSRLAHNNKQAAPVQAAILTVHELKRPAHNAAELMALETGGIQLPTITFSSQVLAPRRQTNTYHLNTSTSA